MKKQHHKPKDPRQKITDEIREGLKKKKKPEPFVPYVPPFIPPKQPKPYPPCPLWPRPWVEPWDTDPWYPRPRRRCPCPDCPGHDDYRPTIIWCGIKQA
jgi:hypothetical protein